MAAVTLQLPTDGGGSTADFRLWGLAISNQLTSFGLPKTTDAGQINWATVTPNGSANTVAGYEIRTFSDPLTATANFYIKIYYGSSQQTAVGLWFAISTATDGSGNLIGQQTTPFQIGYGNGNAFSTNQNHYLSGASDRLTLTLGDGPQASGNTYFGIERTKSSTGTNTGNGIMYFCNSQQTVANGVFPLTGTWAGSQPAWNAPLNYYNLSSYPSMQGNNGIIGVVAPTPFNFYPYYIGYNQYLFQGSDFGSYATVTIPTYGNNHTYITLGRWQSPCTLVTSNGTTGGQLVSPSAFILMRFD